MADDPWRETTWSDEPAGQPAEPKADGSLPTPVPAEAPASVPLVAWAPPSMAPPLDASGGAAPFTVGGLLSDLFARYGADPARLFLISLVPAAISAVGAELANSAGTDLGGLGASLAVSLLAAAFGIVTTSITFALAEGGRSLSTGTAVDAGIGRAGWLFLTALAIGALLVITMVLTFVAGVALAAAAPVLAGLAIIVGVLVASWLFLRLSIAMPAVVADGVGPGEALARSWRMTGPAGVWLRILAAGLLIGLLIAPASMMVSIVGWLAAVPDAIAVAITAVAVAFTTPMVALLQYSAYRRLVPPSVSAPGPSDDQDTAGLEGAMAATGAATLPGTFVPPRMGTGGRAVLGLTVALAIIGLVSIPWAVGQLVAGQLNIPGPGLVGGEPRVEFGATANLASCTITGAKTTFGPDDQIVWLAYFPSRVTPTDTVRIEVIRDSVVFANEVQGPGTYYCLGTEDPVFIEPGFYEINVYRNGELVASGSFLAL